MSTADLLIVTFGIAALTFCVRFVPMLACNRIKIPRALKIWLGFVPLSLFAALLTQIFYNPARDVSQFADEWKLIAASVLSLVIAFKTRSVGWGVGLGFAVFLVLYFGGSMIS